MDPAKVLNLANLARIELDQEGAQVLAKDFESILNYVGEVKSASQASAFQELEEPALFNVLRADGEPHETGLYTENILTSAPEREGDYIKVKKIL